MLFVLQSMLGYIWQCFYSSCLRFWLKWFLRLITGRCELQRICARCKTGAPRTSQIEYSLKSSKSKVRVTDTLISGRFSALLSES
uniref:ELMO domain-containing protein 2-like n=1 Tax=Sinocyclocheilus grahami TaxID=75366 RepID=A0A672K175_SINGR